MPSELFKRIDLDKVYMPFLQKVLDVIADCKEQGVHYHATCGYRSFPEQAKLYFQGRTAPGKRVTNAQAGQSMHNYGLAIDFCRDGDLVAVGLQPKWDEDGYKLLANVAELHGLVAGGHWKSLKDWPHVEWKLPSGVTLADLKKAHDKGGLSSAWAVLG